MFREEKSTHTRLITEMWRSEADRLGCCPLCLTDGSRSAMTASSVLHTPSSISVLLSSRECDCGPWLKRSKPIDHIQPLRLVGEDTASFGTTLICLILGQTDRQTDRGRGRGDRAANRDREYTYTLIYNFTINWCVVVVL